MGQKLTDRTALTSIATGDLFHVVDVSDNTDSAEGTSKKITQDNLIPDASATVKGKVELATTDETTTGTDATRVVTPDGLHDMTSLAGAAWFLDEDTMSSDSATKVPSQQSVKAYGDRTLNATLTRIPLYAPQGFLINGKISVTDAAGITVAVKTLAGTDPSDTDPVYVRIGDTVRTISSALSVAKADGTNWCNSGSAELATKEIDYFVYLGYNATDGVVIGFSRYPGANSYDDFSATTTNEKYCAISTITNATATDYYEVIGRFAATLSAGAGYTWSVPTYTAKNLIQRPIYETRWLSWLPTYTGSGSLTYESVTGNRVVYKIQGDKTLVEIKTTGTTGGTTNNTIYFTTPFSRYDTTAFQVIGGGWIYDGSDASGYFQWNNTSQTQLGAHKYSNGNLGLTASAQIASTFLYSI